MPDDGFPPLPVSFSTETLDVLLIEDEPDHAELIQDCMRSSPSYVRVRHVTSLTAAAEALADTPPRVVILDLGLPESRGLETVHRYQAFGAHIPMLVMTSLDDAETGLAAVRLGAQDFLSKASLAPIALYRALLFGIERKAALDEVERQRAMLETFAASIGHDLTAPPRQIRDLSQILFADSGHLLPPDAAMHLETITSCAERMMLLMKDILGYIRVGAAVPKRVPVQLDALVERVRRELPSEEAARVSCPGDLTFHADPGQLYLVMRNLIANGLKYWRDTPSEVVVTAEMARGSTVIQVRDTGIGIPADIRETVFQPGRRGVRGEEFQGTGYGLAICREIIGAHQGKIQALGGEEGGTVIEMVLPAK